MANPEDQAEPDILDDFLNTEDADGLYETVPTELQGLDVSVQLDDVSEIQGSAYGRPIEADSQTSPEVIAPLELANTKAGSNIPMLIGATFLCLVLCAGLAFFLLSNNNNINNNNTRLAEESPEVQPGTTLGNTVPTETTVPETTPDTEPPATQESTAVPAINDTPAPPIDNNVTFIDNFTELDTSVWRVEDISSFGDGNNEEQCYLAENTSVRDGKLVLRAREQTVQCERDQREVTSGMVRSRGVTFSPGQGIDFRVKLNPADTENSAGLWPALWASDFGGIGWPRGGELDFFEVMTAVNPTRVLFSMHFENEQNQNDLINTPVFLDEDFSDDWHTFRFDYGLSGKLTWYLDGEIVQQIDDAPTVQGYPAPFNSTIEQLRVNLALGGNPGDLDRRAVGGDGATYEIDYIRIFDL